MNAKAKGSKRELKSMRLLKQEAAKRMARGQKSGGRGKKKNSAQKIAESCSGGDRGQLPNSGRTVLKGPLS